MVILDNLIKHKSYLNFQIRFGSANSNDGKDGRVKVYYDIPFPHNTLMVVVADNAEANDPRQVAVCGLGDKYGFTASYDKGRPVYEFGFIAIGY